MNKVFLLILPCLFHGSYADNMALFNQAMAIGAQHQFKLNLNQNSSIVSYGVAESFSNSVATNANAGVLPAQDMYTKVQGTDTTAGDPNYLYNSSTQLIKDCEKQHDPKCTTINKYADKGTQTEIQAYTQSVSPKYLMSIASDPLNKACDTITRKMPINVTKVTCTAGLNTQQGCLTTVIPYSIYYPPVPANGTIVVNASNKKQTDVYSALEVVLTVTEALTQQNSINAHIIGSSPDLCGWNYQTYDGVLSLTNIPDHILAQSGTYGCNGGHRYVEISQENSPGCDGTGRCILNFMVATGWGKDGHWHTDSLTYQAVFTKQKLGYTDNGFKLDEQCAPFKP